jgi:hypothetical protein
MKRIRITAGDITAEAELNETHTAEAIWQALPISGTANKWGDEIYFAIPVDMDLENGQEIVLSGDLGYWPTGNAFCIFFGPTPVSGPGEIRPASEVNVFGRVSGDPRVFTPVKEGNSIRIEKA